jgi:Transposase DDE domain group 1
MIEGANVAQLAGVELDRRDLFGDGVVKQSGRDPAKVIVLDMDSSESPTYGEQEGSAYSGHFGCACYHPLFVFNPLGDVERCALRPGNVHSEFRWCPSLVSQGRGSLQRTAEIWLNFG